MAEFAVMGCDKDGFEQAADRPDLPAPAWGTEQTIKPAYPRFQLRPGTEVPSKLFGILKPLSSLQK
ncbi:hypothetical protein QKW35_10790 [Pontibacterium granulatum]|uniref:hypothetical protein n=1 Tax=Pontibacterium granulatum TaxID=2036029 RepID=UPI00249C2CB7|nr:hypothetical protein [Pontibacterium granulatum]MDI3324864.1 hypothetical protein [Pontibacterium granulatum]